MRPRYLQLGSGQPFEHGEFSRGREDVDTCTCPAPRGHDGRRVVGGSAGTWEVLLARFELLFDGLAILIADRHPRVVASLTKPIEPLKYTSLICPPLHGFSP